MTNYTKIIVTENLITKTGTETTFRNIADTYMDEGDTPPYPTYGTATTFQVGIYDVGGTKRKRTLLNFGKPNIPYSDATLIALRLEISHENRTTDVTTDDDRLVVQYGTGTSCTFPIGWGFTSPTNDKCLALIKTGASTYRTTSGIWAQNFYSNNATRLQCTILVPNDGWEITSTGIGNVSNPGNYVFLDADGSAGAGKECVRGVVYDSTGANTIRALKSTFLNGLGAGENPATASYVWVASHGSPRTPISEDTANGVFTVAESGNSVYAAIATRDVFTATYRLQELTKDFDEWTAVWLYYQGTDIWATPGGDYKGTAFATGYSNFLNSNFYLADSSTPKRISFDFPFSILTNTVYKEVLKYDTALESAFGSGTDTLIFDTFYSAESSTSPTYVPRITYSYLIPRPPSISTFTFEPISIEYSEPLADDYNYISNRLIKFKWEVIDTENFSNYVISIKENSTPVDCTSTTNQINITSNCLYDKGTNEFTPLFSKNATIVWLSGLNYRITLNGITDYTYAGQYIYARRTNNAWVQCVINTVSNDYVDVTASEFITEGSNKQITSFKFIEGTKYYARIFIVNSNAVTTDTNYPYYTGSNSVNFIRPIVISVTRTADDDYIWTKNIATIDKDEVSVTDYPEVSAFYDFGDGGSGKSFYDIVSKPDIDTTINVRNHYYTIVDASVKIKTYIGNILGFDSDVKQTSDFVIYKDYPISKLKVSPIIPAGRMLEDVTKITVNETITTNTPPFGTITFIGNDYEIVERYSTTIPHYFCIKGNYSANFKDNEYSIIEKIGSPSNLYIIAGDHAAEFLTNEYLNVYGATLDNGNHKIISSIYSAPNTVIVVDEALTGTVADGKIRYTFIVSGSYAGENDGILTDAQPRMPYTLELNSTYINGTFVDGDDICLNASESFSLQSDKTIQDYFFFSDKITDVQPRNPLPIYSTSPIVHFKNNVRTATTANLNATYAALYLTSAVNIAISIDGINIALNDRVLVKNQTVAENNGIYYVTTVGSGSVPWVMKRTTDADSDSEIRHGIFTVVNEGTINARKGFILSTPDIITLDTTELVFVEENYFTGKPILSDLNYEDFPEIDEDIISIEIVKISGVNYTKIKIAGNYVAILNSKKSMIRLENSKNVKGEYTIYSVTYSAPNTEILLEEIINLSEVSYEKLTMIVSDLMTIYCRTSDEGTLATLSLPTSTTITVINPLSQIIDIPLSVASRIDSTEETKSRYHSTNMILAGEGENIANPGSAQPQLRLSGTTDITITGGTTDLDNLALASDTNMYAKIQFAGLEYEGVARNFTVIKTSGEEFIKRWRIDLYEKDASLQW